MSEPTLSPHSVPPTAGAPPAQGEPAVADSGSPTPGRCRIRVIDTFGTEPAYNHEEYATRHGYRTNWGYWNLNPKQFMTMFRECPGRGAGRWALVVPAVASGRRPLLLPGAGGTGRASASSRGAALPFQQVCEPETEQGGSSPGLGNRGDFLTPGGPGFALRGLPERGHGRPGR